MKKQNKIEYRRVNKLLELNNKGELTEQEKQERDRLIDEIYYLDTGFQNIINGKIRSYSVFYTGKCPYKINNNEDLFLEVDKIFNKIVHSLLIKFKGTNIKNPGAYIYNYLFKKRFNKKDLIDVYFESNKRKKKISFLHEDVGLNGDIRELFDPSIDLYASFENQDKVYKENNEKLDKINKNEGKTIYINRYSIDKLSYYCKTKYKTDNPYIEAREKYEKAKEKKLISWQKYKQAAENRKTIYTYHTRSFQENLHNLATWQDYIRDLVIHKLPKKAKEIIIQFYWYCKDTKQIAAKNNITPRAVNKTKNSALNRLKNYILGDANLIKEDYPDSTLDYYTYTYQNKYKKVI